MSKPGDQLILSSAKTAQFSFRSLSLVTISVVVACRVAFIPEFSGLSDAGRWTFFILLLAAGLWITESLHRIPATVISFLPITIFAVIGILSSAEIRHLEWDVLILIAGGLALGVGVNETGLGEWLFQQIPSDLPSDFALAILLAYFICILSNFMSNTAAASVFIPTVLGLSWPVKN